jgi:hypothetical protein
MKNVCNWIRNKKERVKKMIEKVKWNNQDRRNWYIDR